MPEIQAFRGIRYDLGHVGALSEVVAPPYDVIDDAFQNQLYKQHPANVIRLILNRAEPGDGELDRYSRAARFLRNWLQEGVLSVDPDPAIYVYHQVFTDQGQQYTRRGFMARVGLEPFGEGSIYPHEETHASAKVDRMHLMQACRANLSQVFGLYPDPENAAQDRLESAIRDVLPIEATDHLGVVHRIWSVSDLQTIQEVTALMGGKPVYIADGHHRYETACNYRQQLRDNGPLPDNHPANFVLMMCVGMSDPGMIVLPTHRLFRGVPRLSAEELQQKISPAFETRLIGEGTDLANLLWEQIETEGEQGVLGLYTAKDQRWVLARVTEAGKQRMDQISPEHSADWRGLGVSLLHRLVIDELLDLRDLPKPNYVHLVRELVEGLDGDDSGQEYPLAALVMPASLDHIRAISEHGERMPAKSTYFYPKLLSGLVVNPLE